MTNFQELKSMFNIIIIIFNLIYCNHVEQEITS